MDPLTKVRDRRWVEDSLPDVVRCWQSGAPWTASLAILDLDHFKQVNDSFRHPAGDDVLVSVAAGVQQCQGVRHVAWIGGEEFVTQMEETRGVGHRAQRRFYQPVVMPSGARVRMTTRADR